MFHTCWLHLPFFVVQPKIIEPLLMIIPGSILSRTGWVENSTGQVLVTPGDCSAYQLSGITTLKLLNVIIIIHQHGVLKPLVFILILSIVSSQSSSINLAKKLEEAIPSDKSIIGALPDFLGFILSFSILYHIWHLWKRIISQTMCARVVEPFWSNEPKFALQPHLKLVTAATHVHAFWEGDSSMEHRCGRTWRWWGHGPRKTNYTSSEKMDLLV